MSSEIDILKRRLQREKAARLEAESILEQKALELYQVNKNLKHLNESLEEEVESRTQALLAKEKEYTQLVENANDIIYTTDEEGFFLFINNLGIKKFELEREDIIGKRYLEFIRSDYKEKVFDFYSNMKELNQSSTYNEFPIITQNGHEVWIGQNVSRIDKADGTFYFSAVARDITDRVTSDLNLKKANKRFSLLLENLVAGILVEDKDRRIILTNKTFCDLFNIPVHPYDLIGTDCSNAAEQSKDLFVDESDFVSRINYILESKELIQGDELRMKDGRILTRNFIPILLDDEYQGHLWYYEDITERRNQELLIQRSEEKYRSMMENMELGLMEVDKDGVIQKVYNRFCEMTGYKSDELIGQNATQILLDEKHQGIMNNNDNLRKQGEDGVYEIQIKCKTGDYKWVLISGTPFFDNKGDYVGTLGIHYDISKRKELEQELIKAREIAEKAQEAEKEYLANMSHEIRTPLSAINGMIHLLHETKLNSEQREYMDIMSSSTDILLSLISDILDISKIDAGTLEVNNKKFNLPGTIHNLIRTFAIKAKDKALSINCHIDNRLNKYIIGDADLLNQVLLNLISNAEKFTEKGSIVITAEVKKIIDKQATIYFSVKDTGIGIEQDYLEKIFQNFKQASRAIRDKYGGTGLGLTIARKIVELLGGTLEVDSIPGQGSDFYFTLELKLTNEEIQEEVKVQPTYIDTHDKWILIVEDNLVNQKYLSKLLEKWKINFETALNGKEAVEMIQTKHYDLVFMDLQMPEMNGFEATEFIRKMKGPISKVPIVALTASTFLSKKELALQRGMTDFVSKPFKPVTILEMINTYIGSFNQEDSTASIHIVPFHDHLDIAYLDEIYAQDYTYAYDMFEIFLSTYSHEIEGLDKAMNSENHTEVKRIAHKIKPTFKMVGLSSKFDILELMERTDNISIAKSHYDEFKTKLEDAIEQVRYSFTELAKLRHK